MTLRCERCERTIDTLADTGRAGHTADRLNRGLSDGPLLCPGCASTGAVWSARNAWNRNSTGGG